MGMFIDDGRFLTWADFMPDNLEDLKELEGRLLAEVRDAEERFSRSSIDDPALVRRDLDIFAGIVSGFVSLRYPLRHVVGDCHLRVMRGLVGYFVSGKNKSVNEAITDTYESSRLREIGMILRGREFPVLNGN